MKRCYICEAPLMGRHEQDHYPVPKSMGGTVTAPVCITCHDLKDRLPLYKWDPVYAHSALAGLWRDADADQRIVLAKLFHIASQGMALLDKLGNEGAA